MPDLPVGLGEVLYVALAHVLDHVELHGSYPPEMAQDMRLVLAAYSKGRSRSLAAQGVPQVGVDRYTDTASGSLARWLNIRALGRKQTQGDFDRWQQELFAREDDDDQTDNPEA
jgi:hypothetical protein